MDALGDGERETLLRHLTEPDEEAALGLVRTLVRAGVTPERILLDLIAPAQVSIGGLWQDNRLSVFNEHLATSISERLVGAAIEQAPQPAHQRGNLLVACAEGEWHGLPARLVSEILRLRGWRVWFLGAHVPAAQFAAYLAEARPVGALFSATLASRLPQVHRVLRACRRSGVPTLVGGSGFGADGALACRIGADAWAPDATAAVGVLERWPPKPGQERVDPQAEAEYALLCRDHWRLIDDAMKALASQAPMIPGFSPDRIEGTIAELGYVLEFLASAVYVDDDELFIDFVRWLAPTLAAHNEPVAALEASLTRWEEELVGLRRARRILAGGRAALRESPPP